MKLGVFPVPILGHCEYMSRTWCTSLSHKASDDFIHFGPKFNCPICTLTIKLLTTERMNNATKILKNNTCHRHLTQTTLLWHLLLSSDFSFLLFRSAGSVGWIWPVDCRLPIPYIRASPSGP